MPRRDRSHRQSRYAFAARTGAGLVAVVVAITLVTTFTASTNVPASSAGTSTQARLVSQLAPAGCSSLTLTTLVEGSGTFSNSTSNALVLGSAGSNTITDTGNGNCIVGGGGTDTITGTATDICITGPTLNVANPCPTVPPVYNLTIVAVASPAAAHPLYPGGNGDVVVSIASTNTYPVTITALSLPTNSTYAAGYTTSGLGTAQTGCGSGASLVAWNYSTATSGSTHTLTTPLIVGANSTLLVTFTNDASMGAASPAACESTFFSMPSLTAVTATGGSGGTATTSPATDAWTS
jgi:hypothetical protein